MSAAALFASQFNPEQAPVARPRVSALTRIGRALGVIGLMLVGAYPEPNARRMVGARRRSARGREPRS